MEEATDVPRACISQKMRNDRQFSEVVVPAWSQPDYLAGHPSRVVASERLQALYERCALAAGSARDEIELVKSEADRQAQKQLLLDALGKGCALGGAEAGSMQVDGIVDPHPLDTALMNAKDLPVQITMALASIIKLVSGVRDCRRALQRNDWDSLPNLLSKLPAPEQFDELATARSEVEAMRDEMEHRRVLSVVRASLQQGCVRGTSIRLNFDAVEDNVQALQAATGAARRLPRLGAVARATLALAGTTVRMRLALQKGHWHDVAAVLEDRQGAVVGAALAALTDDDTQTHRRASQAIQIGADAMSILFQRQKQKELRGLLWKAKG